jgi:hypothetical protein
MTSTVCQWRDGSWGARLAQNPKEVYVTTPYERRMQAADATKRSELLVTPQLKSPGLDGSTTPCSPNICERAEQEMLASPFHEVKKVLGEKDRCRTIALGC